MLFRSPSILVPEDLPSLCVIDPLFDSAGAVLISRGADGLAGMLSVFVAPGSIVFCSVETDIQRTRLNCA